MDPLPNYDAWKLSSQFETSAICNAWIDDHYKQLKEEYLIDRDIEDFDEIDFFDWCVEQWEIRK